MDTNSMVEYTYQMYQGYCRFIRDEGYLPSNFDDWVEWNETMDSLNLSNVESGETTQ